MWLALSQRLHGWLGLAGLVGFVWCGLHHVCCGGHLAHPPYPWWHYGIDTGWAAAFAISVACGLARPRRFLAAPVLLAGLAVSRLVAGSGSGFLLIPVELPAALAVAVLLVSAAVGPVKMQGLDSMASDTVVERWPPGRSA